MQLASEDSAGHIATDMLRWNDIGLDRSCQFIAKYGINHVWQKLVPSIFV